MSVVVWSRLVRPLLSGILLAVSSPALMAFEDGYEETIRTTRGVYVMRGNARADEFDDVASSSITAKAPDGRTLFHRMTDLRPGCDGFKPHLIDIGPAHQRTRIVLLCGSTGGPHQTLFAFVDGTGSVAEVDGDRVSPDPYLSDHGELFAHALYSGPIEGVEGLFVIPDQLVLRWDGHRLSFDPVRGALHSPWAKELLAFHARRAAEDAGEWPRYYVVAHALLGDRACQHLRNERPDFAVLIGDSMRRALNRWISSTMSIKECS